MMGKYLINNITTFARFAEPVSWIGQGRTPGEVCLGFETGRLSFTDLGFEPTSDPSPVFGSGEAINGAVFVNEKFALSTRNETIFGVDPVKRSLEFCSEGGAHGIVGSDRGTIVAPLGIEGLRCIQRQTNGGYSQSTLKLGEYQPYFYQTIFLGHDIAGFDLFASACRSDGAFLTAFGPDHSMVQVGHISPLATKPAVAVDIVSVCSLNKNHDPFALAMLAMDGAIYFARDYRIGLFARMYPRDTDETPYSIHSSQGHLFIHTSNGITAVQDIAGRFLTHDTIEGRSRTFRLLVDAVDCSIINNEHLMIIESEQVSSTPISALFQSLPGSPDSNHRLAVTPGVQDLHSFEWSANSLYEVSKETSKFAVSLG